MSVYWFEATLKLNTAFNSGWRGTPYGEKRQTAKRGPPWWAA